jgi:hypothetical protein
MRIKGYQADPAMPAPRRARALLRRLVADRAANTTMLFAAALVPMLAMIGGGVDMGRSYLSQSRLQQACDAGVLAARKKLGSNVDVSADLPADARDIGSRFFNINFHTGAYGTENRNFAMELNDDFSVSGVASASVPTSIMKIFGYSEVPVQVECSAQMNMNNTDIMMVLDTTASMSETNPDDDKPRIDILRDTINSFHTMLESNKAAGTRIRYGFLPYSTNVNVGQLLKSDWMVDNWTYQTRKAIGVVSTTSLGVGSSWNYWKTTDTAGTYTYQVLGLQATCPASTNVPVYSGYTNVAIDPVTGLPPAPPQRWYTVTQNGLTYSCAPQDGAIQVAVSTYNNYFQKQWERFIPNTDSTTNTTHYNYLPLSFDVTSAKDPDGNAPTVYGATIENDTEVKDTPIPFWYHGCIEERGTYEITDYSNVDLAQALDLDLDRVPSASDSDDVKWRPMFAGIGYTRGVDWGGNGTPSVAPILDTDANYLAPDWLYGTYACPSPAKPLGEYDATAVSDYLDGLETVGNTYHDIGMIWGGRMISKDGLFSAENADIGGRSTNRNLIFLTDGETAPLDILNSSYGIEPLDQRRWHAGSALSLTETVEQRFLFACNEVRNKNVTIWVISFGTEMTDLLTQCAGDSAHTFQADNAAALQTAFNRIAGSLADLRINR